MGREDDPAVRRELERQLRLLADSLSHADHH